MDFLSLVPFWFFVLETSDVFFVMIFLYVKFIKWGLFDFGREGF